MAVKLPEYLDDFIYKELGGYFQSGLNVDSNIDNDEEANKKYIGTYFPRSLVQFYYFVTTLPLLLGLVKTNLETAFND